MKKLLLFSLILIFSCKTKTVIEPKKSLAEICQDSFPCKIDSFYIKENDTIIETNYITNKDTLVLDSLIYINTETTKTIKKVIEKSVLIDYKTTPDYVILSDSLNLLKLNNSNLSDSLNNFKTDKFVLEKEIKNKDLVNKRYFFINIFTILLILLLSYLLGKKKY